MYEYVCDHLIPGCTYQVRDNTPEAVRAQAIAHLHAHHDSVYLDDNFMARMNSLAIITIR